MAVVHCDDIYSITEDGIDAAIPLIARNKAFFLFKLYGKVTQETHHANKLSQNGKSASPHDKARHFHLGI